MAIMEQAYYASFDYQVTNYFAASRYIYAFGRCFYPIRLLHLHLCI